jgi:hypothetical protein
MRSSLIWEFSPLFMNFSILSLIFHLQPKCKDAFAPTFSITHSVFLRPLLGLTAGVEKGSGHRGREGQGAGCRERWNGGDAMPRPRQRGVGGGRPWDDALAGDFTGITPEMKAKLQRGEASRGSDLIACAAGPWATTGLLTSPGGDAYGAQRRAGVPCPGGVRRSWWRFSQWQRP